ncbi:MAG: cupin domain-containing protein [Chloroflexi bacterium]|nr:cupin domain-containing protein [Chloroflexota bacterium]
MSDTPSGVHALKDLIQTQSGSVVSRTLVKKPTGTVTAFAFAEGEGLSEHTAPFEALVIGVEGEAEVRIDGQPHTVRAGDLLVLPANHPHAVKAAAPFKMLLVMIRESERE